MLSAIVTGAVWQLASAVALVNGQWMHDGKFVAETRYIVDGKLASRAPGTVSERIDLAGQYVVSAFGEAHNHNVDSTSRLVPQLARYVQHGVLFVANPAILPRGRAGVRELVNGPGQLSVAFSSGGITGPGGHPLSIVQRNIARGAWTAVDGDGAFVTIVDNATTLAKVWPKLLALSPDFVKVFVLYGDEYQKRLTDSTTFGWRGVNPPLLPEIVRRSHAAGKRVMAHIETAADFRAAVSAGADIIGHMPGFRGDERVKMPNSARYTLSAQDARAAALAKTIVVTTLGGAAELPETGPDSLTRRALDALHRENLGVLQMAGVRLAIGSDTYSDDSYNEVHYLYGLGVFTDSTLIRLWSESTPRAIFPARRVGRLEDGDEASFLSLSCNPLRRFICTDSIKVRVKDGRVLSR